MSALPLSGNSINKEEIKYHGKFGRTIGWIQHIDIMIRIDIYYIACRQETQTVSYTIPCFQGIKRCIQYQASHTHKPIFMNELL